MDQQQQLQHAIQLHQAGRLAEAERLYARVLASEPGNVHAGHYLGVIRYQQGRIREAIELIGAALRTNPTSAGMLSNYGLALKADGRLAEALASFDKSIASQPGDPESQNNRGLVLQAMGRLPEALAGFDKAIALRPDHAEAWNNRGIILSDLKRFDEAVTAFNAAVQAQPGFAMAWNNLGNALLALGQGEEALAAYDRALALKPDYLEALYNRGQPLLDARRMDEALASYDRAIALKPDFAKAFNGRAIALQTLGRTAEALASYDAAIAISPDPEILNNRASLLLMAKRFEEARARFQSALAIAPDDDQAFAGLAAAALHLCDWPLVAELAPEMRRRIEQGRPAADPLILVGYHDDLALHRQAAENYARDRTPQPAHTLPRRAISSRGRIRIAYLSSDFHTHPTASLMAGLFERHDRGRFEIRAISFGPDDGSAMRARLQAGVEHFNDVQSLGDAEVARLLAENGTDIVIDLKGHTQGARQGILTLRPAPIQVSYLGFPGTTGMDCVDYLIADKIVLPPAQQHFFTEKIVTLPHSYQANDSLRKIAAAPTREEAGLPKTGFIFCCFNNSWKITAPVFAIWMRLLSAVPGSVLWLFADNEGACASLRRAATAQGVDPGRLVFAPRIPEAEHLARQQLADLFLDTLPYNAHTTASDALWAGLPLLTCMGHSFPGRVGASLLQAVGLPELVTQSLEEYEAAALKLARDPALLKALREKFHDNRQGFPLFDTDRFRRDIEAVYVKMWEIAKRGEPPRAFTVEEGITAS